MRGWLPECPGGCRGAPALGALVYALLLLLLLGENRRGTSLSSPAGGASILAQG